MDEYKAVRAIDDIGGHHNGVHVHVTDEATGDDLEGVLIELLTTDKSTLTNLYGEGEIIKVKNNSYRLRASLDNYEIHEEIVKIVKGNILHIIIKLKKK